MLELLFLLLPIAACYGWYMGNRNALQNKEDKANHISRQYVAGINLLLSEKSDKAVDLFIDLLQVDSETIDTHLALGNLFRSRGEVDRAIRIHQNLIARPNLTIEQRNLALQQLGKDYMAAGFFDRAEKIYHQLVDDPDHRQFALKQLLAIYQQTKDWEQAIDIGVRLIKNGKMSLKKDVAHFYCELAMVAERERGEAAARKYLRKALSHDKDCVRASLLLAHFDIHQQDIKSAVKHLESILEQDVSFVSEALPILVQCYQTQNKPALLEKFLKRCIEKDAGATAELMMADIISQTQDEEMAQSFLTRQLIKNPTMKGFYKLMELHVAQAEEGKAKASLNTLKELVAEQIKVKPHFCCQRCGFTTKALYWHCPSCKGWGEIKPIKGLDGE